MTLMDTVVDRISAKFAGQTGLADAIGVDQSTIAHWKRRGIIPARQQRRILEEARARKIDIAPADFFEAATGKHPGLGGSGRAVKQALSEKAIPMGGKVAGHRARSNVKRKAGLSPKGGRP